MAKGTSNTMKVAYFLGATFALWYLLQKTELGSGYAGSMLSLSQGVLGGAREGISIGRTY